MFVFCSVVDQLDDHGRSPLAWACAQGKLEIARKLLENGAAVGHQGKESVSRQSPYIFEALIAKAMPL